MVNSKTYKPIFFNFQVYSLGHSVKGMDKFYIFSFLTHIRAVVMMVVSENEKNRFDQRWIQHLMREM